MLWVHLQTIFSFGVYHRLRFTSRWQRLGFALYLGVLSLFIFYAFANGYIRRNLPVFLKNFPQVTFEKGVLTAPQDPVYAFLPKSPFKIEFNAARQTPPTASELLQDNLLMLVNRNTVYMPTASGVQAHTLPETLSITTSPEFLAQHQALLSASLSIAAFMAVLFFIPLVFLFDFCLAASAGLCFNILTRKQVPRSVIFCWAFFLLGPLSVLWYIRLWYPIPLFTLAQVILCIIYMQQIFNLIPGEKYVN